MAVEIREASLADIPSLTRLVLELGYDCSEAHLRRRVERVLGMADHGLYVAVDGPHGVVGCIHANVRCTLLEPPYAEVVILVVASNHRRGGVGRALVDRVHTWAMQRGLDDVVVSAQPHRKAALVFYAKLGYRLAKEQHLFQRDLGDPEETGERTVMD